jgi:hypothetical protein
MGEDFVPYDYNTTPAQGWSVGEEQAAPSEFFYKPTEDTGALYFKDQSGAFAPAMGLPEGETRDSKQLIGDLANYGNRFGSSGPQVTGGEFDYDTGSNRKYSLTNFQPKDQSWSARQLGSTGESWYNSLAPDQKSFLSERGLVDFKQIPTSNEYGAYLPSQLIDAMTNATRKSGGDAFTRWADAGGGVNAMMGAFLGGALGGFPGGGEFSGYGMSQAPSTNAFTGQFTGGMSVPAEFLPGNPMFQSPFVQGVSTGAGGVFNTGQGTGTNFLDRGIESGIKSGVQTGLRGGSAEDALKSGLKGAATAGAQDIITTTPILPAKGTSVSAPIAGGTMANDYSNIFDYDSRDTTPALDLNAKDAAVPAFDFSNAPMSFMNNTVDPQTLQPIAGAPMSTTPALQNQATDQFTGSAPLALQTAGGGGFGAPDEQTGAPVVDKSRAAAPQPQGLNVAERALKTLGVYDPTKGTIGANALPLASLAIGQYNLSRNGKSTQDQLTKIADPARRASEQLINQGLAGQVPAPILQQFNDTFNQQKSAIEARYANMGRDPNNDSSAQREISDLAAKRDANIANYASQLLSQGLAAAGVAAGPATAAVQAGVQQDQQLSSAMGNTMQQLAMLQALQNGQRQPTQVAA